VEKWVPTFGRGANTRENLRADLQTHDYTGPPRHAPVRFGRTRAITHDILYDFGRAEGDDDARLRLSAYGAPLVPVVDIPYLCETQAMKWITPADRERWPHYEHGLSRGFARYQSEAREYGLLHWGDIKLAYGNYATAPGSYANHEYDTVHGLLVQFARAGDRDCHRCAREAARHIADVDVDQVHGGGRMHGYVQSGEHHEECYTGGTLDHAYVEGLLEHYCFTGDRRSLRAFRRIAESCKKIPDVVAERGIAGIDCRTIGRSCIALLAAYDITGLDEYLAPVRTVVDELVEYAGHPAAGLKGSTGWRPWLGEGEHMAEHIHELLARYHYHTGDSAALRTLRTAIDYSIATWDPETERSFGRPDRIGHPPTRNVPPTPQPEPGEAMVSNEFSLAYLASQTGEPIYLRPVVAGMKNYGRGLEHAVGNRDFPHVRLLSAHFIALMAAIDVDRDELARRALLPALAVPLMGDLTCRTGEGDSEATVHGSVDFVDSIFDRPVLQTGKTSWVSFDAPEDILEHPGAVSLWVSQDLDLKSAIDMGPSPRGLVHIADTGSLTNALDVHLTYNEMWVRLYDHRGWLTSCLQVPVPDWRPGEWHHVAAVWNRFTLTAYVDGRRMAQQPSWLPRGGQRTVHVGWRPLNWFAASRFCILRLFRSPLPGYQVEAIYEEECPYSRQEREQMAHYRDEGTWKLARGGGVSIVEGCPVLAADLGAPPAQ